MVFSSTAAAAQQQQYSSSGGGEVESLFLVPAPRVKPERQLKKMEHRRGTFFRDSLHITAVCIADQHCGSCSAMHRGSWNSRSSSTAAAAQQQQHSSSSTAAVVAATSRLRAKRTSVDTPVSLLFSFLRFRAI